MSYIHLMAIILTMLYYGFLAVVYFGWGKVFILAATRSKCRMEDIPYSLLIWMGWACTLFLFQCIHLFFPINVYSVSPVFFLGIALSLGFLIMQKRSRSGISPFSRSGSTYIIIATIIGLLLAASWLASRAMLPPDAYDSGAYHLSTIRWINEYPLIPGLGNLHGRLALNQSFFTYVAALNLHPLFGYGRSIANSFLLLLTVLTLLELLLPVLRRPILLVQSPPPHWAPSVFCLPAIAYWAFSSYGVPSPSPDLTSSLLQVVIFIIFVRLVTDFIKDRTVSVSESLLLFLLAATAITVKLSSVAFSGIIMAFTLVGIMIASDKPIRHIIRLLLPVALVLTVFCLRGIILTGAPFFPATIGYVETEWSVPIDCIVNLKNWIYSWARQPDAHWKDVLGSWSWFGPWLQRITGRFVDVMYPLAVFLTCGAIIMLFRRLSRFRSSRLCLLYGIVPIPMIGALVFWFITAPDPRLANASFMLLPVSVIVLLLTQIQPQVNKVGMATVICVLLVAGNFHFLRFAYYKRWYFKHISLDGWHPVKRVPLDVKVTTSGLRVYTPVTGDQCWDAPLPCTPYFNEALRLRVPNNMASGFTLRPLGTNGQKAERGAALDGDSATLYPRH